MPKAGKTTFLSSKSGTEVLDGTPTTLFYQDLPSHPAFLFLIAIYTFQGISELLFCGYPIKEFTHFSSSHVSLIQVYTGGLPNATISMKARISSPGDIGPLIFNQGLIGDAREQWNELRILSLPDLFSNSS